MNIHENELKNGAAAIKNKTGDESDWVENFAMLGHIAKGIVYCLVGGLAAMAAFGLGGQVSNSRGIMQFILEQPFGRILLGAVALGLVCYVLWRWYQAIKDPYDLGNDTKAIAKRVGYGWSGLIYAALAIYAGFMAIQGAGSGSGNGGGSRQQIVGKVLSLSFGDIIVIAAGGLVVLLGIYQIVKAISGKYKKRIDESSMDDNKQKLYMATGRIGYIARGIVWGIIGYLLIRAGIEHSASQAGGTTDAFQFLLNSGYGPWLMGIVALGLLCYGIFMFVKAGFLRIPNS